ncbi:S-adenosylmethionine decarboxylase [Candidatus Micrarchaeota archaeon]|nr:S-adenosylmethionine decarboxylase [Candidatus Micrarchaeota archaeon]
MNDGVSINKNTGDGWVHLIVEGEYTDKLNSEDKIKQFLTNIAEFIDVIILYGPVVVRGKPYNDGFTGFVIVDYSHIALHTFFENGYCALDIFTCKKFDVDKVLEFLKDYIREIKHVEVERPL